MKDVVLDSESLKRLKEFELELLKTFISTCETLGLKYYVMGGTLLGAVRHKGFIPWDDDIDVAMPRKDDEIWIEKAPKLISEGQFIQTHITDPHYPANFAKLRNSNTTFIESTLSNLDINHGIYIDIFPLDYYPEKNSFSFKLKQLRYTCKIAQLFNVDAIDYSKGKKIIRKIISLSVAGSPYDAVVKRDELYKSSKSGSLLANFSGAWGDKEIVPADWYGEGVTLLFEGLEVSAPKEYKKWLQQVYGDYMQLPPEEKRVTHHYTEVIDLDKSYKQYRRG